MQNALKGLRDTLPKSGQKKQYNTLNSLMQKYGTGGGMEWTETEAPSNSAFIGLQRAQQPQNAISVGSRRMRRSDGRDQPDSMTNAEAEQAAQIGNAENAPEVAGALMGLAPGPMGAIAQVGAQGLTSAMKNALGPYGVTGLPTNPQVGTPAFAQATPAQDTAPGYSDAGSMTSAMSNQNLSPQAAFGNQAAPAPDIMGGIPSFSDIAGSFANSVGLTPQQDADAMFSEAMSGVASGRYGRGAGIGGIGNNTTGYSHADTGPGGMASGGRAGPSGGGGQSGGTATGNAMGGPNGVGRGNDRGGGVGF